MLACTKETKKVHTAVVVVNYYEDVLKLAG